MGDQKYYAPPNAAPATHVLKQAGKGVVAACVTLSKPLIPASMSTAHGSPGPAAAKRTAARRGTATSKFKFKLPPRGSFPAPPNYNKGL